MVYNAVFVVASAPALGEPWPDARVRMPLYTAEALILRTYKLGEADRIVVFLTRDRGKRRGVALSPAPVTGYD